MARTDNVSVCGEEPTNHPLVFVGDLERFDFLLQHAFFGEGERRGVPGRGYGDGRGSTGGGGGCKIV